GFYVCSRKYHRSACTLRLDMNRISKPSSTTVAGTKAAVNATGENHPNVCNANRSAANTAILRPNLPSLTAKIATGEIPAAHASDSPEAVKFPATTAIPSAADHPAPWFDARVT